MEALATSTAVTRAALFTASPKSQARVPATVSFAATRQNALVAKVAVVGKPAVSRRGVVSMAAKETAAAGYAAALSELAKSTNSLEAIHSDLEAIAAMVAKPEVANFLANPVIGEDKKKDVLKSLAADAKLNAYTVNFLYLLVDKKRINILREIALAFEELYCAATDTQVAVVTSAVKLENSQQALIAKKLQSMTGAKNIKLKNVVDPSLIAGFIVKYGKDGSLQIDMSVKGQLDRIAEQLELSEGTLSTA